ncbi:MAG: universal stress protein [Ginsengibacter sp.]
MKILLGIDAVNPDKNALDFACYLARLTKSKVTGVFLENLEGEEKPLLKQMQGVTYLDWDIDENSEEHLSKMKVVEKNISNFKEGCLCREVNYNVHRDRGVPASEIIEESRFADVIVIAPETSFNKEYEGMPTDFVKDTLKKAECPIIIAPESFEAIDEIIFSYDGSASAVFAIKQFTYLFPELRNRKPTILQVNSKGEWHDRDKYHLKEWLKEHYANFQFEVHKGDTDSKLFDYVFSRKNIFLVMGAYGRNAISAFFKHSRADRLIRTISQPIFIAHL